MEISLVPPSFPLTSVRYRNRPILSSSAFPRGQIELDCPVEDSLTSTVNNTIDEKMYRTSVTFAQKSAGARTRLPWAIRAARKLTLPFLRTKDGEDLMPRGVLPTIFRQDKTTEGISLELRWDPKGPLDLPGFEEVLLAIHIGPAAKLTCRRGGRYYSGTAVHGDIDVVPAHTSMRWEAHDQNDRTLIVTLPQRLLHKVAQESELDPKRMEILNRFQIRDRELELLGWALQREAESGYPSGRIYLDGLTAAMASRLVARHSSLARKFSLNGSAGLTGYRLKQVLAFIEEQLTEDLSLERIAAVARVSSSHLNTLFRHSMGVAVHQYVIQRRVELAKTLLMKEEKSITEIALEAGFAHQSHLARHMRRMLGLPPRALKRVLGEAPRSR
jgi:AraC family transcriptional regulator